ncbi:MAG: DNA-deoxyinosine glycosylase [Bacilli bacterium]|nr:DNA-deoxyinosine glycosylase [Bacilli bacterium]MDD4406490.1 DNA-deoxyinosine glycosylase [Bacilli bacterium]
MKKVYSFPPIYNKNSKILILGTIPSIVSRNKNFYYSHPNNRFWKIMEHLFKSNLISIQDKINFLLNNNIALWDTIKECEIYKSQDSSIKNVKINDIKSILDKTNIKKIYVTGMTAFKIYNKYIKNTTNIDAIYLPCPSSANASYSLDKLITIYTIILNNLTIKEHYNNGG